MIEGEKDLLRRRLQTIIHNFLKPLFPCAVGRRREGGREGRREGGEKRGRGRGEGRREGEGRGEERGRGILHMRGNRVVASPRYSTKTLYVLLSFLHPKN